MIISLSWFVILIFGLLIFGLLILGLIILGLFILGLFKFKLLILVIPEVLLLFKLFRSILVL